MVLNMRLGIAGIVSKYVVILDVIEYLKKAITVHSKPKGKVAHISMWEEERAARTPGRC